MSGTEQAQGCSRAQKLDASAPATAGVDATVRVISGAPTAEEIAALVTVLAASAHTDAEKPTRPAPSLWARASHVRSGRPRSWNESRLPR